MQISLLIEADKRVDPGSLLSADHILTKDAIPEDQKYFYFTAADQIPPDSKEINLKAEAYIINKRVYPIGKNYSLKAYITPKLIIIPKTREAVGKELDVLTDQNGVSLGNSWPVIGRNYRCSNLLC